MKISRITYLLVCLIEECAEVIQRACKAIRFGMKETQAGGAFEPNDVRLAQEVADLRVVRQILEDELQVIPKLNMANLRALKRKKLREYMEYSERLGILEKENEAPRSPDTAPLS